jgi:hypothetical protein
MHAVEKHFQLHFEVEADGVEHVEDSAQDKGQDAQAETNMLRFFRDSEQDRLMNVIVPAGAAVLEQELAKRVLQNVDEGGVVGE